MTMVYVTHEIGFAREVADQIVFMDGGIVVKKGGPDIIGHPTEPRFKDFLQHVLQEGSLLQFQERTLMNSAYVFCDA